MKHFLQCSIRFWTAIFLTLCVLSHILYLHYPQDSYAYAFKDKLALLDTPERQPSIVLMGGSSVAFGFQSPIIQDSIGMPVINAGEHVGLGLKYLFDEIGPRLHAGDVVVFASETASHFWGLYYGAHEFTKFFLLHMVPMHDICWRQIYPLITETPNVLFFGLTGREGGHDRPYFNKYGDLMKHWSDSTKHFNAAHPYPDDHAQLDLYALNDAIKRLHQWQEEGIQVVMFSPPGDKMYFQNTTYQFSQVAQLFTAAGFPYPDTLGVDLVDNDYTYNSQYHLNQKGSAIHTQHLIDWLKKQGVCRPQPMQP